MALWQCGILQSLDNHVIQQRSIDFTNTFSPNRLKRFTEASHSKVTKYLYKKLKIYCLDILHTKQNRSYL